MYDARSSQSHSAAYRCTPRLGESDSISIYVSGPNNNSSSTTEVVPSTDGTDRHAESLPLTNQSNGTANTHQRHESNIHTILN
jgi:hypothetical protein